MTVVRVVRRKDQKVLGRIPIHMGGLNYSIAPADIISEARTAALEDKLVPSNEIDAVDFIVED
ncbi:hypothetical protein [Sinorhizobium meliloti]|uniref:hypothetical protein n=1 Tax=Rhizobium meliloti TaxID=382 RepID=UPI0020BD9861|nr:hypothetical protein [Sinorhizobium meliloti]